MRLVHVELAPPPGGHHSQAIVPTWKLHYGWLLEIQAIAALKAHGAP